MAIGAITAGAKALAKKAAKKRAAAKATPKQAARSAQMARNLERVDATERSATTMAQDLNRGIKEFRNDAAAATRSSDRRLARQATGATAAAVAGGAAGSGKRKAKTADPVASRSRTRRQGDR
jgi:hypothetical protein